MESQVIDVLGTTFEEDIEQAYEICEKYLGKSGKIEYPLTKKCIPNAVIVTTAHGKLWYGDLNPTDIQNLVKIQQELDDGPVRTVIGVELTSFLESPTIMLSPKK